MATYETKLDALNAVQEILDREIYNTVKIVKAGDGYAVELTRDTYRHVDDYIEWDYHTGLDWRGNEPDGFTRMLEPSEYTTGQTLLVDFEDVLDDIGDGYALVQDYIASSVEHDDDCYVDDCQCDMIVGHGVLIDVIGGVS